MPETNDTGPVSLTRAAYLGRLTIKYGAISLVALIIGRIFLTAAISFWRALYPPAPPPPTVGFGALPPLRFPTQLTEDKPTNYQLETATGTTPDFGDRAKVFLMIKSAPSLLSDQRAREIAASYGFIFEPDVISTDTYRWRKTAPLNIQLEMNIFNNHFSITSDYLSKGELLLDSKLPDDFSAVSQVKNFLSSADLLPSDVATAAGEVSYFKSLGGELSPAVSLSDADYIQVDLNPNPIDGRYRMFSPEGYKGAIRAVISGNFKSNDAVVEMDYTYQPIEYSEMHTYPLRTSQQAWNLLKAGEGYIAQRGEIDPAVVRQVSLGYYQDDQEQEYLQPIYVFEGDGGFIGFVPALDSRYVQTK